MTQRDGLGVFVRVAQTGSFRKAAASLGLTPSAVSGAIQRLEARLGLALVVRSTRALRLTDEGLSLYERLEPALRQIAEAEADLLEGGVVPRGRLRVTAPDAFGRLVLAPQIRGFLGAHPSVELELINTDRVVDLVREGFDLAVRFGPLADSSLKSRTLRRNRRVTVASPAYLGGAPPLTQLDDLQEHACVDRGSAEQTEFKPSITPSSPTLLRNLASMAPY